MPKDPRDYPFIDEQYPESGEGPAIKLRCPYCGRTGTFEKLGVKDVVFKNTWFGQRRCPNDECRGHVFSIYEGSEYQKDHELLTYPAERPEFDRQKVPADVAAVFDEAITCHTAGSQAAAGMLIRRTLELVCANKQVAGDDLAGRSAALGLPAQLTAAMSKLALFGADADRITAAAFSKLTREQIAIAIEITREALKAAYQYEDILGRLEQLEAEKDDGEKNAGES